MDRKADRKTEKEQVRAVRRYYGHEKGHFGSAVSL